MGWMKSSIKFVLFAYLTRFFYLYFANYGVGVYFNNVHPGSCRLVPGISCGSEQIIVTLDGLAFITNGYKGMTRCNPKFTEGHIYIFDFNNPDENVKELKIISETIKPLTFDPHGMDIIELPDQGIVKVYVVNHGEGKESIEVFTYNRRNPLEIVHTKTIIDDTFVCLNDITVLDEERFFVTNYLKYCHVAKIMLSIELIFRLKTANIVYYNHGKTKIVAVDSFYNGLTLSKDKSKLLTALGSSKDVHVFDRSQDGELTLKNRVFLGHAPDNIFLDKQTGHYYVAYFKDPFVIQLVSQNRSEYSSSGAARISFDSEAMDNADVKEVFYDRGENFVSGSSVFAHYKGQYLIGSIFDKLGYCRK